MKKSIIQGLALAMIISTTGGITVNAQTNGYGQGQGRTDTVNANDYSTDVWDRFEYNYEFNTGVDYKEELGKPTNTNLTPKNAVNENRQNNKDASYNPPSYGVFSGSVETERSNPYFYPPNYSTARETTDGTVASTANGLNTNGTGTLQSTSLMGKNTNEPQKSNQTLAQPKMPTTTPIQQNTVNGDNVTVSVNKQTTADRELNVAPSYYADGSIGILHIPKFKISVKIYEGETLENLKKGSAHFSFTSAYDGNIGICGHNDKEFKNLKNLVAGDEIIYETKYGTRKYEMSTRTVVSDTDYSTLGYTLDNRMTLITCVEGSATERYSVTAIEKK